MIVSTTKAFLLLVMCVFMPITNSNKKTIITNVKKTPTKEYYGYSKILRSDDGINVYADIDQDQNAFSDSLSSSTLQEDFMLDDNYYELSDLNQVRDELLEKCQKFHITSKPCI